MKNKKLIIILSIIIIILIAIISMLSFTKLGKEIKAYVAHEIFAQKETIKIQNQDHIKITYTYRETNESFDINVTDKEIINFITGQISNKKLNNYSGQILLAIMGEYTVDLGNNIIFKFDNHDGDGYVMLETPNKTFLTKIEPEILEKVTTIVDEKLEENIEIFKTDKITISEITEKCTLPRQIEEKTAVEYIIEKCKNIYTKQIDYEPTIVTPNYKIDFNNEVKIGIYEKQDRGWLWQNGIMYEAYGLNAFDTIIKNAFDNVVEREKMFNVDKNKLTITNQGKTVEVTDENIIEKITTNLMYSTIGEPEWLAEYDITEEYNNGIKVELNDCEFLIPGNKTIGNRYIVLKDKKLKLCYPLQDIEQDINKILGIKQKKSSGTITIAVPNDIPKVTNSENNTINTENSI